jgi:hypothetical protein
MLGTVFHYAVDDPEDDHARCHAQALGVIAMHERMGYRRGGAYNGHFCQHGESWISYLGPNQATGNTWANLNLHAWCYLATVGTPVTPGAAQAAYDLTLLESTGRDQIYPHSAFFATSCCGDPLRAWIAAGALPPTSSPTQEVRDVFIGVGKTVFGVPLAFLVAGGRVLRTFDGPIGAYEIPQAALDWKAAHPTRAVVPFVSIDPELVGQFATPWPPAGSGGGGLTDAQARAVVRGELDRTRLVAG